MSKAKRDEIKAGLLLLTAPQNRQFRVIFGYGTPNATTESVVDMIVDEKLDSALATVNAAVRKANT